MREGEGEGGVVIGEEIKIIHVRNLVRRKKDVDEVGGLTFVDAYSRN